jgi:hypothetical protein
MAQVRSTTPRAFAGVVVTLGAGYTLFGGPVLEKGPIHKIKRGHSVQLRMERGQYRYLGRNRSATENILRGNVGVTSALHASAERPGATVPAAALRASLDHLVGDRKQPRRQGEAERFDSLEIDHQFKFGWLQDRQIGG